MKSSKLALQQLTIFPILLLSCLLASPVTAQPAFNAYQCIDDDGNYTKNSPYGANLQTLLSTITSNTNISYGFYNFSVGQTSDKVHGIALCRPDVSVSDCHTCVGYARAKITQECPNQRDAVGWYEDCMIWYSNENIFNGVTFVPPFNITNHDKLDLKAYNHTVVALLNRLAIQAASGDSRRKFATGEVDVNSTRGKQKIFALLECTPNLQEFDCFNCLNIRITYTLQNCCFGNQGARIFSPSCSIRYENYRFYGPVSALPPMLQTLSPPPSSGEHMGGRRRKKARVLIIILIPVLASCILLVITCFYLKCRGGKTLEKLESKLEGDQDESKMVQSLQMSFGILRAATSDFSDANKLGQGRYGTLYKGILPTGQAIAVKRLARNSGEQDFKNEALLMARLQHKNLVTFLGFCLDKDEILLVYEYVPNKSLDCFLYDSTKCEHLNWQKRYKIIEGIARGLLYLHEESRQLIVHRDLKASNVLLDAEFEPKISDFGIARLFEEDQTHATASVLAGTYGYMPPEYLLYGHYSIKSDVFSFGMLVLEIISGQKLGSISEAQKRTNLLNFAWRNWLDGNPLKLVDSRLSNFNTTEVLRCIHIALLCVQEKATQRPIMSSVVLMLNSYSVTLPVASQPAFVVQNDMELEAPSPTQNTISLNHGSISD